MRYEVIARVLVSRRIPMLDLDELLCETLRYLVEYHPELALPLPLPIENFED